MNTWNVLHEFSSSSDFPGKDEIIRLLLGNRGITQDREVTAFLSAEVGGVTLPDAGLSVKEADKAVARLKQAIRKKESVVVYSDYDVDGVTGGAIMWEMLHEAGTHVMPYIPNRESEGYGLSQEGIDKVISLYKPSLLVAVDHGITAAKKIAYAKQNGIDTIVLDHHVLPEEVPDAVALVHSTLLSAGGIAWVFSRYAFPKLVKKDVRELPHTELAALATIADLMPLVGINRIIAKEGLHALARTKRVGLKALFEEAGLTAAKIDTYAVSHIISPRINAMGRLTNALDALRLICTKDQERAKSLAQLLGNTNRERQLRTEAALTQALVMVGKPEGNTLLFVSSPEFHVGIIGLIAGKLTQQFHLPSVVLSQGPQLTKASARSVKGFDIVAAIKKAETLLVAVGGHPMAAGFTVETKNIPVLRDRLTGIVSESLSADALRPVLDIDCMMPLAVLSDELYEAIQMLAPFGIGNPQPVLASRNVRVLTATKVGKQKNHLKLVLNERLSGNGYLLEAIGFGLGMLYDTLRPDVPIDIAYTLGINEWNGEARLQLNIRDVTISSI